MAVTAPRPLLGAVLLMFVSAAWGSAFPLMKDLILRMPVADLLTERYGVAVLVLVALRPRCLRGLDRKIWTRGVFLGLLFGIGQSAQAVALHNLPSPVSGFAVGCNVVMTPLLGMLLLKARVSRRIWIAVALSAAAMAIFTILQGFEGGDISVLALIATLMAAALYAGHTLALGQMSDGRGDGYALTVIQLGTIAVMTGILAAPGGLTLPASPTDWGVLAHLAIVSCALGFLARTYGQAHVPAVPAAVVMASQPLWVALLAALVYGEAITWSVAIGGAMVLVAMLLAVVPERLTTPGDAPPPPGPAAEPHRVPPLPPDRHAHLVRLRKRASEVLAALREEPTRESRPVSPVPPDAGQKPPADEPAPLDDPLREMIGRAMAVVHERVELPGVIVPRASDEGIERDPQLGGGSRMDQGGHPGTGQDAPVDGDLEGEPVEQGDQPPAGAVGVGAGEDALADAIGDDVPQRPLPA